MARAVLSGVFGASACLIWMPALLRSVRRNELSARLGVGLVLLGTITSIALAGIQLRQTAIIRQIAADNAKVPPATITYEPGGTIAYVGQIGFGSYARLLNALDAHPDVRTIVIESNGGIIAEAT